MAGLNCTSAPQLARTTRRSAARLRGRCTTLRWQGRAILNVLFCTLRSHSDNVPDRGWALQVLAWYGIDAASRQPTGGAGSLHSTAPHLRWGSAARKGPPWLTTTAAGWAWKVAARAAAGWLRAGRAATARKAAAWCMEVRMMIGGKGEAGGRERGEKDQKRLRESREKGKVKNPE